MFTIRHCLSMENCGMVRRVTSGNAYVSQVKQVLSSASDLILIKFFVDDARWVYFHSPRESKQFKEYIVIKVISDIQKQPLADIFQNRCS